jgi:hypothetical protein
VCDELRETVGGGDTPAGDRFDGVLRLVEGNALMAMAREAANHVCTHPSQADHAELHRVVSLRN